MSDNPYTSHEMRALWDYERSKQHLEQGRREMNDNNRVTFNIWKDFRTGAYEVVRWEGNDHLVVQTNIPTRGKAMAAADLWRQREKDKSDGTRTK